MAPEIPTAAPPPPAEYQIMGLARRGRVLTNSAAEWIELRAEDALGPSVADLSKAQYVPELDRFVGNGEVPEQTYYKDSEEKLQEFKKTLASFCKTLKDEKLDKKLKIVVKDPNDYTMDDVVEIAKKVKERHKGSEKVKSCMGIIRRVFRLAGRNTGILKKFLAFVPNDSYGIAISGGFTLILGALEQAESLRMEIYSALTDIPQKLEDVHAYLNIHQQTPELLRSADGVFLAIFNLLNVIIKDLLKNGIKKSLSMLVKGDKYEVKDSVELLASQLSIFESVAKKCSERRIGRIEDYVVKIQGVVQGLESKLSTLDNRVASSNTEKESSQHALEQNLEAQKKLLEEQKQVVQQLQESRNQALQVIMLNQLYGFLTSTPAFDPVTGQLDELQARRYLTPEAYPLVQELSRSRSPTPEPFASPSRRPKGSPQSAFSPYFAAPNVNKALAEKVLGNLDGEAEAVTKEISEYLSHFESYSLKDKDRLQIIMASDELREWMSSKTSRILVIEAETAPEDFDNVFSLTSALLTRSFSSTSYCTVLSYFCAARNHDDAGSDEEDSTAPISLLQSLNAQLLAQFIKAKRDMDLSFMKKKRYRKALDSVSGALELFHRIVEELTERDTVFIVLDSVSRLPGTVDDCREAINGILESLERTEAVMKVLITDLPPDADIDDREYISLYVEDDVDGGREDIDIELLAEDSFLSLTEQNEDLSDPEDLLGTSDDDDDESDDDL